MSIFLQTGKLIVIFRPEEFWARLIFHEFDQIEENLIESGLDTIVSGRKMAPMAPVLYSHCARFGLKNLIC